jgi:hypothetical protein
MLIFSHADKPDGINLALSGGWVSFGEERGGSTPGTLQNWAGAVYF